MALRHAGGYGNENAAQPAVGDQNKHAPRQPRARIGCTWLRLTRVTA
jgi:hypothetical protein